MIQLMLVDDHHLVRNGFRLILESQKDMAVLADVETGEMALDFLTKNQAPNLILTDIKMEEMDGISLITHIKENYPQIKIIVLSMLNDRQTVSDVLNAGGDLVKDSSADEVLFGIRQIANGEKYLSVSLGISCVENYRQYIANMPDKGYVLAKYDISERN